MVELRKTRIIYDWLAFSADDMTFEGICYVLFGNTDVPFVVRTGSNRFYQYMATCGHIWIHYTIDSEKCNPGVFVEMSGQGCREFEQLGKMSLNQLLEWIKHEGLNCSRLDVAFDDMNNHYPIIDIDVMAEQAQNREFTTRLKRFKIDYSADQAVDDIGISVQHGSKASDFYLRVYDKRCEQGVYDKCKHWVRCEMQLRGACAVGFIDALGAVGKKFRAVLTNYVNYRVASDTDTNKRRWAIADWWQRLIDGVSRLAVAATVLPDYTRSKLEDFVYRRCARAILALLAIDGLDTFIPSVLSALDRGYMPAKYTSVIAQSTGLHPDLILYDGVESFLHRIGYYHDVASLPLPKNAARV